MMSPPVVIMMVTLVFAMFFVGLGRVVAFAPPIAQFRRRLGIESAFARLLVVQPAAWALVGLFAGCDFRLAQMSLLKDAE